MFGQRDIVNGNILGFSSFCLRLSNNLKKYIFYIFFIYEILLKGIELCLEYKKYCNELQNILHKNIIFGYAMSNFL